MSLANNGLPIEILLVEDNHEDAELTMDVLRRARSEPGKLGRRWRRGHGVPAPPGQPCRRAVPT